MRRRDKIIGVIVGVTALIFPIGTWLAYFFCWPWAVMKFYEKRQAVWAGVTLLLGWAIGPVLLLIAFRIGEGNARPPLEELNRQTDLLEEIAAKLESQ